MPVLRGQLMKIVTMVFGDFLVQSYGNGAAYDVIRNGEHFFVQGDDALKFKDECEASSWVDVCNDYMDALGEIYA